MIVGGCVGSHYFWTERVAELERANRRKMSNKRLEHQGHEKQSTSKRSKWKWRKRRWRKMEIVEMEMEKQEMKEMEMERNGNRGKWGGGKMGNGKKKIMSIILRFYDARSAPIQGFLKKDCPKLRNQNRGNQTRNRVGNKTGNQTGGNEATAKAYAIGGGGTNPDSNVVTGPRKYFRRGWSVYLVKVTSKKAEDKSEEKRLEDVPIIREFRKVFPDDLPGLPPARQVEFQINLVWCFHLEGIHVDHAKIESIKDWASPKTPTEILAQKNDEILIGRKGERYVFSCGKQNYVVCRFWLYLREVRTSWYIAMLSIKDGYSFDAKGEVLLMHSPTLLS
ncbi:hypothetical protein Tco_0510584 [Tanacetum coccineum]